MPNTNTNTTNDNNNDNTENTTKKQRVLKLLREAAVKAVGEGDPWAKYELHKLPAERIIRHLYHPETRSWSCDETIVKVEPEPFTHGAMRFCYRMKKRAQPPKEASNHHFHSRLSWSYAANYVAKAYIDDNNNNEIDCSEEAKQAVQNDILLQYEAQHWANQFNDQSPPTKIHFIRAYAIEFPDRPGRPWLAVERFIAGTDLYGAGFVKHNTNSGFVDTELRRVTPQIFSAFSFYQSHGTRLVADIQGVGDLYTDPQVLSDDYRFGDGDLGPRGMALFFHSYRSCGSSDALGIPLFPLSRNELKAQAKYEEEEVTLSDDELSLQSNDFMGVLDAFQKLDLNRKRRASSLLMPKDILPLNKQDTARRSNVAIRRDTISQRVRQSLSAISPAARSAKHRRHPKTLHRTASDIDEVQVALRRALTDRVFTNQDFHRRSSGELRERQFRDNNHHNGDGNNENGNDNEPFHKSSNARVVSPPMVITDTTKANLGKVHYQLAILHGMGRFPHTVPEDEHYNKLPEDILEHDAFSVLFHLSYASSLHHAPACLALGRLQAKLESHVSHLLPAIVTTDFDNAKSLLHRAMTAPHPPTKPKAAAGCLLYQILHDEHHVIGMAETADTEIMQVLQDTLALVDLMEQEEIQVKEHQSRQGTMGGTTGGAGTSIHAGDRVEADYALEGSYYPAVVESVVVSESGGGNGDSRTMVTVRYDDDGSCETLPRDRVRPAIPPTATQTSLGGPLSDEEAFGEEHGDDGFILTKYDLQYELAVLKEQAGDLETASSLYEMAADGAMADGKMKTASEWSLKAAETRA